MNSIYGSLLKTNPYLWVDSPQVQTKYKISYWFQKLIGSIFFYMIATVVGIKLSGINTKGTC